MLPVTFADGRVETLEADSATTAGEMVDKLSALAGLKDNFGFSIYICIYDKVSKGGKRWMRRNVCQCWDLTVEVCSDLLGEGFALSRLSVSTCALVQKLKCLQSVANHKLSLYMSSGRAVLT